MVQQCIRMPAVARLSAPLYMPGDAKPGEKFPALLEYLPYRKDDATAARDYPIHALFAARGYLRARLAIYRSVPIPPSPTLRWSVSNAALWCRLWFVTFTFYF